MEIYTHKEPIGRRAVQTLGNVATDCGDNTRNLNTKVYITREEVAKLRAAQKPKTKTAAQRSIEANRYPLSSTTIQKIITGKDEAGFPLSTPGFWE